MRSAVRRTCIATSCSRATTYTEYKDNKSEPYDLRTCAVSQRRVSYPACWPEGRFVFVVASLDADAFLHSLAGRQKSARCQVKMLVRPQHNTHDAPAAGAMSFCNQHVPRCSLFPPPGWHGRSWKATRRRSTASWFQPSGRREKEGPQPQREGASTSRRVRRA